MASVGVLGASGGVRVRLVGVLGSLADYRLRVPSGFPSPGLAVYLFERMGDAGLGLAQFPPDAAEPGQDAATEEVLETE